ncbi:MAG: phage tail protein, partial [Coprobacillus sp.]
MDNGKYNFCITINSKKVATFLEVSGNDLMMEPFEYRQGYRDLNSAVKRQVLTKYTNITFKIGVIYDLDFLHWIIDSAKETVDRKTIRFCLYD